MKEWAERTAGLTVASAGEEGAYAVVRFVDLDRARVPSYSLCRAPGAPRITLKLALVPKRWLD